MSSTHISKILDSLEKTTNLLVLPYLLPATLILGLLEVVSYPGFLKKYTLIDFRWLAVLTTFLLFFALYTQFRKKKTSKYSEPFLLVLFYKFCYFLWIPLTVSFFIFEYLEFSHYPNYVFATFHIQHKNFGPIYSLVTLSAALNVFGFSKAVHAQFQRILQKFSDTQRLILLTVIFVALIQSFGTLSVFYNELGPNLGYLGLDYQARMIKSLGGKDSYGWMIPYTQFINEQTPADAILFLPPQMANWEMSGNGGYMRYFVHPRKTISATEILSPVPTEATHVLISHGEWIGGGENWGWPKITIPAEDIEKITYLDRRTGEVSVVYGVNYEDNPDIDEWGVITLKK